jgi:two-component system, sensor histidine kinase and response regulator
MKGTSLKINSIIAHDLRDSLASISGISEILISNWEYFSQEEKLEILEEIKETSDSTMRLLSDLLNWGKKVAEVSGPEMKVFNAGCVISTVIKLMNHKLKRKNLEIRNLIPAECTVYGDEYMFAAIIRNLLANAVKSCINSGLIEVSADTTDLLYRFCVADNGIGMTKVQIDHLFPVDKKDSNTSSSDGFSVSDRYNNGFGLILCRDFVKINGGKLWAESQEGIGTSVFFTITGAATAIAG